MATIKLKIPTLETAPLSNFILLRGDYFEDKNYPKIGEIIRYVADWCGTPYEDIAQITRVGLTDVFNTITNMIADYEPKAPRFTIGKYELVKDYLKMSAGWWHHVENIDLETTPEQLLGLIYMEKGMGYAEMDKNKNIINPAADRAKEIASAITLRDFMDLMAFFLNTLEIVHELSELSKYKKMMSLTKV
jgi:hypothetical protein